MWLTPVNLHRNDPWCGFCPYIFFFFRYKKLYQNYCFWLARNCFFFVCLFCQRYRVTLILYLNANVYLQRNVHGFINIHEVCCQTVIWHWINILFNIIININSVLFAIILNICDVFKLLFSEMSMHFITLIVLIWNLLPVVFFWLSVCRPDKDAISSPNLIHFHMFFSF